MKTPTSIFAGAAAGVFAIGAFTGWMAPTVLRAARADTVMAAAGTTASASTATAPGPIPLGHRTELPCDRGAEPRRRRRHYHRRRDEGIVRPAVRLRPFGKIRQREAIIRCRSSSAGCRVLRTKCPMHAQGSGFIVSSDGIVLTNAHVVEGAKEVTVKLIDHREFKAKVLGTDKTSDIAVLKIDAHELPTVRIGNSDQLGVGDYVLAIGAPFGLEETATAGIVSATGRSLPGDGAVPFIQTDAAVNPGNSGGPLFDATGAVVGINSQIYTNSGGYQGVSFAIPINLAEGVEQQIVKTGKVEHGRLGVEVQSVDQSLAQSFKLSTPAGALVAKVEPEQRRVACGAHGRGRDSQVQRRSDRRCRSVIGAGQRQSRPARKRRSRSCATANR